MLLMIVGVVGGPFSGCCWCEVVDCREVIGVVRRVCR